MKGTLTEKILSEHLISGKLIPGEEICIKIDQTLTQDATGTMAWLEFESLGIDKVKTFAVSYIDHNTLQVGFENADDHEYLRTVAMKHGAILSKAGNGICHQLHLENFAFPGQTLLGSDSHTPTAGAVGMFAIGAGGLEVAVAMATKEYYLKCPEVINISLKGNLNNGVSAKDVILKLLQILGTKNSGKVIEYSGEISALDVPERATITNMGAELGVTTSIFNLDKVTKKFISLNRHTGRFGLFSNKNAEYNRTIELNLNELVPMVAKPHNPGNVCTVKEAGRLKVDQVCIGSCTNSSYRDLMTVADYLKRKKVHVGVELIIALGSRKVLEKITSNGGLETLLKAGARIAEPACGFCIGQGYSPQSKGVRVATSNRNFEKRSGTDNADVYLVSPETAVATAVNGYLTDPREFDIKTKRRKSFVIFSASSDNSLWLYPPKKSKNTTITRGPNIGEPLKTVPLKETLKGIVTIKLGDKITTDHITPAGSWLKYRSNIEKYSQAVFIGIDKTFYERAKSNKGKGITNFIVAGEGYGEGSSREHASICPAYLGVKAVIAKSFQRIHSDNLVNFGIIPLQFANANDYTKIERDDKLHLSNIKESLQKNEIKLHNETKNYDIPLIHHLSERQIEYVLAGGLLNSLKKIKC